MGASTQTTAHPACRAPPRPRARSRTETAVSNTPGGAHCRRDFPGRGEASPPRSSKNPRTISPRTRKPATKAGRRRTTWFGWPSRVEWFSSSATFA